MNNYNFEKRIYKNGINYSLEISLPYKFNNFLYKVYGNEGFYNYGKFILYKNNEANNTLVININKVQYLFISLITKKNKEYYDFIDMNNMVNNIDSLKNIKLKIERENSESSSINFKLVDNIEEEQEDQEEDKEEDNEDTDSDSTSDDGLSVSSTSSSDNDDKSDDSLKKTILL